MVGLCLPELPHPDDDSSMRSLVRSLQTDVANLQTNFTSVQTNQANLSSRVSSLEMRNLTFTSVSDELGNSCDRLVETSIDGEYPRLLTQTPVQEVADHPHDQMVGQCGTLTPNAKTSIEQRLDQLECSTSSHDHAIQQLKLTYMVCMQRMDSLPVAKPVSKSL